MAVAPCLTIGPDEPVLISVGLELILRTPRISRPEIGLPEAHLVENLPRKSRFVIRKFLGIMKGAVHAGDDACFPAQVPRRPAMAERHSIIDPDQIARPEARSNLHQIGDSIASQGTEPPTSSRPAARMAASTAATLLSISALVSTSCSTSRLRMARIHFS